MFDWWTVKGCVMRSHFHLPLSNVGGVHLTPAVSIWPLQNSQMMKVRSPKVPPWSSGGSLSSVPAPAPTQKFATCTFSSHSRLAPPRLITFPHCPWWSVFAYALLSDAWDVTFTTVIQRSLVVVFFVFVLLIFTPHLQATEQVFNRTSVVAFRDYPDISQDQS